MRPHIPLFLRANVLRGWTTLPRHAPLRRGVWPTRPLRRSMSNEPSTTLTTGRPKFDNLRASLAANVTETSLGHFSASDGTAVLGEDLVGDDVPYLERASGTGRSVHVETYGCQMNVSDTEIVLAIVKAAGFHTASTAEEADVVLVNTCAIREGAEQKVWNRLYDLRAMKRKTAKGHVKTIGVIGCMAERLKTKLLESDRMVDLVVGPDAYRDLPRLLQEVDGGDQTAINTILSFDETYADITPVRTDKNKLTAFVSIMRGCNNMCSYCIVPFTRGRERSRALPSILDEIKMLRDEGYKEITLLGQNVNSYNDTSTQSTARDPGLADGFATVYKAPVGGVRFAELLDKVSAVAPEVRIRFTSPHPKDFPNDTLDVIRDRDNLCNNLHMPPQSGSTANLARMRRGYSRESFIDLVHRARKILPNVGLSGDFISGFCGETESEHQETLSLMRECKFDQAYMFAYSQREKTKAHRTLPDDVPADVKLRRLQEVIATYREVALEECKKHVGEVHLVLIEGRGEKNKSVWFGRTDNNKRVLVHDTPVVDDADLLAAGGDLSTGAQVPIQRGDFIGVRIEDSPRVTMYAQPLVRSSIGKFRSVLPFLLETETETENGR